MPTTHKCCCSFFFGLNNFKLTFRFNFAKLLLLNSRHKLGKIPSGMLLNSQFRVSFNWKCLLPVCFIVVNLICRKKCYIKRTKGEKFHIMFERWSEKLVWYPPLKANILRFLFSAYVAVFRKLFDGVEYRKRILAPDTGSHIGRWIKAQTCSKRRLSNSNCCFGHL